MNSAPPKIRIAHALFLDNLHKLSGGDTRALLTLNLMVFDQLTGPDSWLLTCPAVHEVVLAPDGPEFLSNGLIRPFIRDDLGSMAARFMAVRDSKKPLHGFNLVKDAAEKVSQLVDKYGRPLSYNPQVLDDRNKDLLSLLFQSGPLRLAGLSEQAIQIVLNARDTVAGWQVNTYLVEDLKPLLPENDREKFQAIVRAIYGLGLPTLNDFGIAGLGSFSGHELLRAALGDLVGQKSVGELDLTQSAVALGDFKWTINDRLVAWLLSRNTLVSITVPELLQVHKDPSRPDMQIALANFMSIPSTENWLKLSAALEKYLRSVAGDLFRARVRSSQITADPLVADQTNLLGASHQVAVQVDQSRPLSLADLPAMTKPANGAEPIPVQFVGRALLTPVAPPTK